MASAEAAAEIVAKARPAGGVALADALREYVRQLWAERKFPEAVQACEESVSVAKDAGVEGADLASRYNMLGVLQRQRQRVHDARRSFQAALQASPGDFTATGNLAELLREQGEYSEAARLYTVVVDADPSLGRLRNLAGCLTLTKQYDQAVEVFERCVEFIKADPSLADDQDKRAAMLREATEHLADALMRAHKPTRAITLARSLVSDPPKPAELARVASFQMSSGMLDDAVKSWEQVIAVIPEDTIDHPRALEQLAQCLSANKETERSIDVLKQAVEATMKCLGSDHPEFAARLFSLATALIHAGRIPEAFPLAQRSHAIFLNIFGAKHAKTMAVAAVVQTCVRIADSHGKSTSE